MYVITKAILLNRLKILKDTFLAFRLMRKTIFFPGQLAFCKKAVVGLAARRIF